MKKLCRGAALLALLYAVPLTGHAEEKDADTIITYPVIMYQNIFIDPLIEAMALDDTANQAEERKQTEDGKKTGAIDHGLLGQIPLPAELQEYIREQCEVRSIDPYLILAIIETESSYQPAAISYDGQDYDLMQIRQVNHERLSREAHRELDFLDSIDNVTAGIILLTELYDQYYEAYGIDYVLMAYNSGEAAAGRLLSQGIYSTSYSRSITELCRRMREAGSNYIWTS